jgi:hypothetical protein
VKKGTIGSTITKDVLIAAFDREGDIFNFLEQTPVYRSFPSASDLTVPAVQVLCRVLEEGKIMLNLRDEGIRLCYEKGWLHSDHSSNSTLYKNDGMICYFPSRLHEK